MKGGPRHCTVVHESEKRNKHLISPHESITPAQRNTSPPHIAVWPTHQLKCSSRKGIMAKILGRAPHVPLPRKDHRTAPPTPLNYRNFGEGVAPWMPIKYSLTFSRRKLFGSITYFQFFVFCAGRGHIPCLCLCEKYYRARNMYVNWQPQPFDTHKTPTLLLCHDIPSAKSRTYRTTPCIRLQYRVGY